MIGIIGAMKQETDGIISLMEETAVTEISGVTFTVGKICGKDAVVATCGIGKVFAALCAQTMILTFHPDEVINVGVAGALDPSLRICDLVIAESVVQHDMDTSPLGDPKGLVSGVNMVFFPCSESLADRLWSAADSLSISTVRGTVASGDQFVAEPDLKACIREEFGAAACEMEGAAIGQVCYVNNVPFCVLRAISDGASEDGAMDYMQFCDAAAKQSTKLIGLFFEK